MAYPNYCTYCGMSWVWAPTGDAAQLSSLFTWDKSWWNLPIYAIYLLVFGGLWHALFDGLLHCFKGHSNPCLTILWDPLSEKKGSGNETNYEMHSEAPPAWKQTGFTSAQWGTWEQGWDSISVNMFTEIGDLKWWNNTTGLIALLRLYRSGISLRILLN